MTRMEERELSLTQSARLKAHAKAMRDARVTKLLRDGMGIKEIADTTGYGAKMVERVKREMKG